MWIAASGKYKKCSLLASCTLFAARKANFLSLRVLAKKSQCSHAREYTQAKRGDEWSLRAFIRHPS